MAKEMLTLESFEEASEIVSKVVRDTKLVYSEYFSNQTGNKVYLKPENMQLTGAYSFRRRQGKGTYNRISRKPRTGRSLCSKGLWSQGCYSHAYNYSSY